MNRAIGLFSIIILSSWIILSISVNNIAKAEYQFYHFSKQQAKSPPIQEAEASRRRSGGHRSGHTRKTSSSSAPSANAFPMDPVKDGDSFETSDGKKKAGEKVVKKRQTDFTEGLGQSQSNGGMVPVRGPYTRISSLTGFSGSSDGGSGLAGRKETFRSWNEYTDTRKSSFLSGSSRAGDRRPTGYVPVMNPDDHFRYMDKLYKAKNDRVKTFHDLYMYAQKQGRDINFGK